MTTARLTWLLWGSLLAACSATRLPGLDAGEAIDGGASTDGGSETDAGVDAGPFDGGGGLARPFRLKIPQGYDGGTPAPLVVLLHGYGSTGQGQDSYFGLSALADDRKFLLATPDGTVDGSGRRFWNATDACCNFGNSTVDDVAYLNLVIDDVQRRHPVDPKRIFVIGHSNGGFMAYRLACEASPRIAGIVSLAGAMWKDGARCQPTQKVAILQVHGTHDATIRYDGGAIFAGGAEHPGAVETVSAWASRDGCGATLQSGGASLDLVTSLPGKETRVERFSGCDGGAVELWTIEGGSHIPAFGTSWASAIYGFLTAHPKP